MKKDEERKKNASSSQMKCLNNMRLIVPSENAKYKNGSFNYNRYLLGCYFCVLLMSLVLLLVARIKMTNLITLSAVYCQNGMPLQIKKKKTKIVIFDECSS